MQVNFTWGHVKDLRGKEIADLRKAKADLHVALDIMTDRAQAAEQQLTAEREAREKAEEDCRIAQGLTDAAIEDYNAALKVIAPFAKIGESEALNATLSDTSAIVASKPTKERMFSMRWGHFSAAAAFLNAREADNADK